MFVVKIILKLMSMLWIYQMVCSQIIIIINFDGANFLHISRELKCYSTRYHTYRSQVGMGRPHPPNSGGPMIFNHQTLNFFQLYYNPQHVK